MPMALLAVFHAACIVVAGIFSSRVTSANSEVLVGSSTCGLPSFRPLHLIDLKEEELAEANALSVLSESAFERGRKYARSCYPSGSKADSTTCSIFTRQWLETYANSSDACPFQDNICDTAAITLDSGLIDSDFHLGINTAASDRIQLRKILSCASIPVEKLYSSNWIADSPLQTFPWDPDSGPGVLFKYYYLGPQVYYGIRVRDFTFVEANYSGSWRKAYTSLYVHNLNVWIWLTRLVAWRLHSSVTLLRATLNQFPYLTGPMPISQSGVFVIRLFTQIRSMIHGSKQHLYAQILRQDSGMRMRLYQQLAALNSTHFVIHTATVQN
jgi:hypothetical protein